MKFFLIFFSIFFFFLIEMGGLEQKGLKQFVLDVQLHLNNIETSGATLEIFFLDPGDPKIMEISYIAYIFFVVFRAYFLNYERLFDVI